MITAKDLSQEVLTAVRQVGQRHNLNPNRFADCITLVTALGAVLLAIVKNADDDADGVVVSKEDDGLGVLVTVHSNGEYHEVQPIEVQ